MTDQRDYSVCKSPGLSPIVWLSPFSPLDNGTDVVGRPPMSIIACIAITGVVRVII